MDRRRLALAVVVAACACSVPPATLRVADAARLVVIGDEVLPVLNGAGRPRADAGGLSGAYYDAASNRLYAVSDDRTRPRIVGFDVRLTPSVTLVPREVVTLQPPPGGGLTLDAEGLAPAPGGGWFVSSEGDPAVPVQPLAGIHEYTRDGVFVRSLPLPSAYVFVEGDEPSGMRLNLSLEALSASPDGTSLVAAVESSLLQDGPVADFDGGAVVRILVYDLGDDAAAPREYAYRTDSMRHPSAWTAADGDAGVVDVLALSATDLLVLERGYLVEAAASLPRRENTIRIYRVRLDPAAEVTGRPSLVADPPRAMLDKRLVLDLATAAPRLRERLRGLENFEAMTLGPRLSNGDLTLMLVSDDNFSPTQVTALVLLRWSTTATNGGSTVSALLSPPRAAEDPGPAALPLTSPKL